MTTSYPQLKLSLPEAVICKLQIRANKMELTVNAYIRYLLIRFVDRVMWLEFVAKDDPEFVRSWTLDIPLVETVEVAESSEKYHRQEKPKRGFWWSQPTMIRNKVIRKIKKRNNLTNI